MSNSNCASPSRVLPTFEDARHHLSRSKHHYTFASSHTPALYVQPGELIHVETWDCYGGAVDSYDSVVLDESRLNPVTGPIYVADAMPGDTLSVTLHNICPGNQGVAMCDSDTGQLSTLLKKGRKEKYAEFVRFFTIDDGIVTMIEEDEQEKNRRNSHQKSRRKTSISFPSEPMLGVVGVAPEGKKRVRTTPAGKHGGNLDNKLNGIGSTVHLPVKHPGALLSVGDMHASQGDGEICGTGVEVSGDVLLSCSVIKGIQAKYPITETDGFWVTHGVTVENIPGATTIACQEAANILMNLWGFSADEAFIFLSVKGDLGLCQAIYPDEGTQIARMMVPKLDVCPSPFPLKALAADHEKSSRGRYNVE